MLRKQRVHGCELFIHIFHAHSEEFYLADFTILMGKYELGLQFITVVIGRFRQLFAIVFEFNTIGVTMAKIDVSSGAVYANNSFLVVCIGFGAFV